MHVVFCFCATIVRCWFVYRHVKSSDGRVPRLMIPSDNCCGERSANWILFTSELPYTIEPVVWFRTFGIQYLTFANLVITVRP